MTLQIVIDMNLSLDWVPFLNAHGWNVEHWSAIGDPRATDAEIMAWFVANNRIVFMHDLDFGTFLALTHATGPSVLQVRTQDALPDHLGSIVAAAFPETGFVVSNAAPLQVEETEKR